MVFITYSILKITQVHTNICPKTEKELVDFLMLLLFMDFRFQIYNPIFILSGDFQNRHYSASLYSSAWVSMWLSYICIQELDHYSSCSNYKWLSLLLCVCVCVFVCVLLLSLYLFLHRLSIYHPVFLLLKCCQFFILSLFATLILFHSSAILCSIISTFAIVRSPCNRDNCFLGCLILKSD